MKHGRGTVALAFVIASCMYSFPARAQTACNQPEGSFDQVYCDFKVLVKADDELNTVYQKLIKKLTPSAQQVLRRSQRAWIVQRDHNCVSFDSQQGDVVYTDCAVSMTTSRLNFLSDRYRECLSSGCQVSKLN